MQRRVIDSCLKHRTSVVSSWLYRGRRKVYRNYWSFVADWNIVIYLTLFKAVLVMEKLWERSSVYDALCENRRSCSGYDNVWRCSECVILRDIKCNMSKHQCYICYVSSIDTWSHKCVKSSYCHWLQKTSLFPDNRVKQVIFSGLFLNSNLSAHILRSWPQEAWVAPRKGKFWKYTNIKEGNKLNQFSSGNQ